MIRRFLLALAVSLGVSSALMSMSLAEASPGPPCYVSIADSGTFVSVRSRCMTIQPNMKQRARAYVQRKSDGRFMYLYGPYVTCNGCESRVNSYWSYYIFVKGSYQLVYA